MLVKFLCVICINREEGRTWYTPYRGCLWIASTANKTDPKEITEIENKYLKAGNILFFCCVCSAKYSITET